VADLEKYLKYTEIIDCDTGAIGDKARAVTRGLETDRERAVALFYFVRDEIRHNPYAPTQAPADHKASVTLRRGSGQCQHKSALLVALARAAGIPARPGYVDIRDHLLSEKFRAMIGGDNLLIQHGYAELYVDGRWLHVSPAYGRATCEQSGFVPVEFDGTGDAKDSPRSADGRPHIEHVKDHGHFEDFPWEFIVSYRKEWVAAIGRGWDEYSANVKSHNVE
jgi:transglutaminase-like putative cysteine protease